MKIKMNSLSFILRVLLFYSYLSCCFCNDFSSFGYISEVQ